jgi:signal peptidase I
MVSRGRTLAVLFGAATVAALVAVSFERHVVRGESMKPTLHPRDTAISVRTRSPLGLLLRLARHPHPGDVAVIALPWEHDLIGIKRLVAGPGDAWVEGGTSVPAGPGWVVVGDERTLSTDSRHHGRVPSRAIRGVMVMKVAPPAR